MPVLADTSVWVDHLRASDDEVVALLAAGQVLTHPYVIGELALGNLRGRGPVLTAMRQLPAAMVAQHAELMVFIERRRLWGLGIGLVDAHLLASAALTAETRLWTRDRRLRATAERLGLAADVD